MTLILRCVDISISPIKIDEHFVEFLKVDNTFGKRSFQWTYKCNKKFWTWY